MNMMSCSCKPASMWVGVVATRARQETTMRSTFFAAFATSLVFFAGCSDAGDSTTATEESEAVGGAEAAGGPSGYDACPGLGWVSVGEWQGLKGNYRRAGAEPPPSDEFAFLSVGDNPSAANGGRVAYARLVGNLPQRGVVRALGDNPAIGAVLAFEDGDGNPRDMYWGLGVQRNALTGRVERVCTGPSDGDLASEAFMLERVAEEGFGVPSGYAECPGLWTDTPGNWEQLRGHYTRANAFGAPLDEMRALSVLAEPSAANQGNVPYLRSVGFSAQTGTLRAVGDNPAIGAALLFNDALGNPRDVYWGVWVARNPATGQIERVCTGRADDGGQAQRRPFVLKRTPGL
jgi:hypothetical protein